MTGGRGAAFLVAIGIGIALSSHRAIIVLAVIVIAGACVSYKFYWDSFASVWFFFAAAASVVILSNGRTASSCAPGEPDAKQRLLAAHAMGPRARMLTNEALVHASWLAACAIVLNWIFLPKFDHLKFPASPA